LAAQDNPIKQGISAFPVNSRRLHSFPSKVVFAVEYGASFGGFFRVAQAARLSTILVARK
jgi:hypothetical protein